MKGMANNASEIAICDWPIKPFRLKKRKPLNLKGMFEQEIVFCEKKDTL